MLPGPLIGLYQQYKEDSNAVAAWLASTAEAFGFPPDPLSISGGGIEKSGTGSGSRRLKGKARKEAELMDDLEEALFAYTLMITGLNKVRSHIGWIWKNVSDGLSDLAAAALATNTACDLARNKMEDVLPLFERHGGAVEIARNFFLAQCKMKGFLLSSIAGLMDSSTIHETYDVTNDTCFLSIMMLKSFIPVLSKNEKTVPLYPEGIYGVYDPSRSRASMSIAVKFSQDKLILMEFFTEVCTVNRSGMPYPMQDEFMRGMKELNEHASCVQGGVRPTVAGDVWFRAY